MMPRLEDVSAMAMLAAVGVFAALVALVLVEIGVRLGAAFAAVAP